MAVRDGRGDVKQTTTGFRDPRHHICQKQIPIPGRGPQKRRCVPNAYSAFNEFFWELKIVETQLMQHDFFDLIYCAEVLDDAEACFFLAREFDHWRREIIPRSYDGEGKVKEEMKKWCGLARACRPFAEYLYRKAVYRGCDEAASPLAFFCQQHHRADERIWWQHAANRCQDTDAMGEVASWYLRSPNRDTDRAIFWFQQAFQLDGPYVDALDYVDTLKKRGKPEDIREAIAVLAMLVDPESTLSNDLTDSSEMPALISQKEVEERIRELMPDSYAYAEMLAEHWCNLKEEEDGYLARLHISLADQYAESNQDRQDPDPAKSAFWAFQSRYCHPRWYSNQWEEVIELLDEALAALETTNSVQYSAPLKDWRAFREMNQTYQAATNEQGEKPSDADWWLAHEAACVSIGWALANEFMARGERHLAKTLYLHIVFLPEGSDYNPKQTEAIRILANEFFSEDDDELNGLFEKSEELDDPVYDCRDLPDIRKKQQQEAGWSPDRPWGNRLKKLIEDAGVSDEPKTQSVMNVMRIDHSSYVTTR